jgi:conjugative relaxase-like TrwC/TraI family protein
MISLSNVASAGGAMHYFSQDNYYTQEQGLQESGWFGRGAEILGLTGKVEKEQFAEILKGHVGGQELESWLTMKRPVYRKEIIDPAPT